MRPVPVLIVFLAATTPASANDAGADPHDFVIELRLGQAPAYDGPVGLATLLSWQAGQGGSWRLDLPDDYTVAEIRVNGAFDIERPRQLVPGLDDDGQHDGTEPPGHTHPHLFVPLVTVDVHEVDAPARVATIQGDADAFVLRLGLPGPGEAVLHLERDVEPPAFQLEEPDRISHFGFDVHSTTDEPAIGTVEVWSTEQGPSTLVPFPTPNPAFLQIYPVQGLQADTDHTYRLTFEDWAGNRAASDEFQVRTLPVPDFPKPVLSEMVPVPGAIIPGGRPVTVQATIASPDSPVYTDGVRLFVDKVELHDGFQVEAGRLTWVSPGALPAGDHTVAIEVRNEAGGFADARWSFTVLEAEDEGAAAPFLLLGLVVAALVFRRRIR